MQRSCIEAVGVRIALVQMNLDEDAVAFFAGYELDDVARFSDSYSASAYWCAGPAPLLPKVTGWAR